MDSYQVVILVSANVEWRAVRQLLPAVQVERSPFGEYFDRQVDLPGRQQPLRVLFFHGGWGKIAAAASTQYAIQRWQPVLLVNLGTCGGFAGRIERGAIILAQKTIVYDIYEQMGDAQEHIEHYTTRMDLSWLPGTDPKGVVRSVLVSGDRDLFPEQVDQLSREFGASAGDWESGAIAWVASRSQVRCLILRGVSDLVGPAGGEAYGNIQIFEQATLAIMQRLLESLPHWLERALRLSSHIRPSGD